MNRYPVLVVILLFLVVIASGCIDNEKNNNQTKTYAKNGISFVYNGTWQIANTTSPNAVVAVGDPQSVNPVTSSPNIFVLIQKSNSTAGTDIWVAYQNNYRSFFNSTGKQRVSEANITINNVKAYENVYTEDVNGTQKKVRAVWLAPKGTIYVIFCSAPVAEFEKQQKNFDLIINSFKVQ
jgi:hypothetical protein